MYIRGKNLFSEVRITQKKCVPQPLIDTLPDLKTSLDKILKEYHQEL